MSVLAEILPIVGEGSSFALRLYQDAATQHGKAAADLIHLAKAISGFISILKQLGTIIKEDDRIPSPEAFEDLEDIISQSRDVFEKVELALYKIDGETRATHRHTNDSDQHQHEIIGVEHLESYLEALRATLSVMLQTMYTAQSIMWSKLQPTVSPQNVEKAVTSERIQLEMSIIEQQTLILSAIRDWERNNTAQSVLLSEANNTQSLALADQTDSLGPQGLYKYQDRFISTLKASTSSEHEWLPSISSIAAPQAQSLLDRWTSLPQFDDRLRDAELEMMNQKRETQQPSVESDEEEDSDQRRRLAGTGAKLTASRSKADYIQPLFMEPESLPVPMRDASYGPIAPHSPAASPRTSRSSFEPAMASDSPTSSRSSISSLPVEATAAIEAKEIDEDMDLEIPWKLCTRKYYWKYIDNKVIKSNTDNLPSVAFLERSSWTEIMASWVCKEAIREAGYRVTQVQKERQDGRRTRFETCFCIERPLQFQQIKQLVERTVELYRQKKPATPPPQVHRSSFQRPLSSQHSQPHAPEIDRDRTPVPKKPTHPPLERSTTARLAPPSTSQRLDRTLSNPGPGPKPIPVIPQNVDPRASNLQIPMPPQQYSTSLPHANYGPSQTQGPYSPRLYPPSQGTYPPHPTFNPTIPLPPPPPPPYGPQHNPVPQRLAPKQSHHHAAHTRSGHEEAYYSTTDSETYDRERRKQRSREKSRHSTEKERRRTRNRDKAAGALLGVGGLTALLDGLSVL